MTAKKSNSDKYNNNREGERETNERKRARSDRKGGGKGAGQGKALVLSGGRDTDGFGYLLSEAGEMVLGVLCLSGRLNVLCTKLCGPRAHWEI